MRRNMDAWWPHVEAGAEAIVITASGCGTMVKDYAYQLARDPAYADKARRISELARDISEVMTAEEEQLRLLVAGHRPQVTAQRIAFHSPCTLQHGLKLKGTVESLLTSLGLCADARPRLPPLLRLSRHVFPAPTRAFSQTAGKQDRRAGKRHAGGDSHCEHRLPGASAGRNRSSRAALDRSVGRDS